MIKLGLLLGLVVVASLGFGAEIKKHFPQRKEDYFLPLGFAALLALLQLVYYPAMFWHWHSLYEHAASLAVIGIGLLLALKNFRSVREEIWGGKSLWILLAVCVFGVVFYHTSLEIAYSDSQMYLNYMSQNVNAEKINLFHIWTGEWGKEWDAIYLFQGYYHFGSFLCWGVNALPGAPLEYITIQTWGLGLLYSLTSSCFLVNFAYRFSTQRGKRILLCLFGLLYVNFYYWRVAFSFYGNTFRTMYIAAYLYYLYLYFKEENSSYRYICIVLSFAGLASSSSYLFIAFALNYALMVFLFKQKGRTTIREMADFVLPLVIYVVALFSRSNPFVAVMVGVCALLYYIFRSKEFLVRITDALETYLQRRALRIFVYGAAALLALGGAVYYFFLNPSYEYNYAHYFQNHQLYDMIKDYFFVYSGKTQKLMDVFRWGGVLLLCWRQERNTEVRFAKYYIGILLFVFLSPLSTVAIAKLLASNVYYRTFDALFNPFTEMLLLKVWMDKICGRRIGRAVLTLGVAYLLIYAHVFSFLNPYAGEYGEYVHEKILPKYKLDYESYDAASFFRAEMERVGNKEEGQWRIISHVEGLRTFTPNIWQIFTLREYYYAGERINEEFYQQARNHYSYGTYYDTDFSSACSYLRRFDIDYLLIEYHNNPDYDIEVNKCSERIYENGRFRIYRYSPAFEA